MPYKDKQKQKEAQRRSYLKNKEKYQEMNKANRQQKREFIRRLKESTPCADCGVSYPYYVMDMDHVEDNKVTDVSTIMVNGTMKQLEEEVSKCEIVCSNCHRERTQKRLR